MKPFSPSNNRGNSDGNRNPNSRYRSTPDQGQNFNSNRNAGWENSRSNEDLSSDNSNRYRNDTTNNSTRYQRGEVSRTSLPHRPSSQSGGAWGAQSQTSSLKHTPSPSRSSSSDMGWNASNNNATTSSGWAQNLTSRNEHNSSSGHDSKLAFGSDINKDRSTENSTKSTGWVAEGEMTGHTGDNQMGWNASPNSAWKRDLPGTVRDDFKSPNHTSNKGVEKGWVKEMDWQDTKPDSGNSWGEVASDNNKSSYGWGSASTTIAPSTASATKISPSENTSVWDAGPEDWAALSKKWEDEREKKLKLLRPTFEIAERDPHAEEKIFETSQASGDRFKDLEVPVEITGTDVPSAIKSFEEANLFWLLRENTALCKYNHPTPVQKYAIPIIMAGRDLTASAQTGSGKTAAFLIPVLDIVLKGGPCDVVPIIQDDLLQIVYPLVLILEPTRELAQQLYNELKKFSYRSWIRSRIVYGGTPLDEQVKRLQGLGVDLLIATPGRLQDLINREVISLKKLRCLVLDEADRMLDMGFLPAIRSLTSTDMPTPLQGRQTTLFSATFPPRVEELVREFQAPSAIRLRVGTVGSLSTTVSQTMIKTTRNDKDSALLQILKDKPPSRTYSTLIFVDSKAKADELTKLLLAKLPINMGIACMRGGMDQWARESSLSKFRRKDAQVLVATAVASRGLDIPSVEHVINYDLPRDDDDYIHRCGRTGRAGYEGKATTLFQIGRDEVSLANLVRRNTLSMNDVGRWLGNDVAKRIEYEIEHPQPPPTWGGRR